MKMKIFKTIQEKYAILGISSSKHWTQKYSSGARLLFGFLLFGCNIVSLLLYILLVASGFMEYMECISTASGTFIMFVCYATIVFKRTLIFETIDNIEIVIVTSEPF